MTYARDPYDTDQPPGVDPDDKWGPWLAFPLAERGWWHLFGWVNT